MAFNLKNQEGSEFHFSGSGWTYYLSLAQEYGWRRAGTRRPRSYSVFKRWHGGYDSNEGQRVVGDDASALAAALELALQDADRATKGAAIAEEITQAVRAATGSTTYKITIAPDDAPFIEQMIAFFRKGPFEIT